MKRTYAALALISIAFLAPEAWEAYALATLEQDCPEVRVTCECEVGEEAPDRVEDGYRVGVPYE